MRNSGAAGGRSGAAAHLPAAGEETLANEPHLACSSPAEGPGELKATRSSRAGTRR